MKTYRGTRLSIIVLTAFFAMAGCRSHMVTISLLNTSKEPVSTVIVDYPSATFGKDKLAPSETFSSPVKLTDTGPIKVQFTDAKGTTHHHTGPVVLPNAEGTVEIKIDQSDAMITSNLIGH
jgi:hypothetical protein